jgi:predicted site-specific integrase-resolvase
MRKTRHSGLIIVDDEMIKTNERTAVYVRISSSENKTNFFSQSKRVQDFCAAKGWVVSVPRSHHFDGNAYCVAPAAQRHNRAVR